MNIARIIQLRQLHQYFELLHILHHLVCAKMKSEHFLHFDGRCIEFLLSWHQWGLKSYGYKVADTDSLHLTLLVWSLRCPEDVRESAEPETPSSCMVDIWWFTVSYAFEMKKLRANKCELEMKAIWHSDKDTIKASKCRIWKCLTLALSILY